VGIEVVTRFRYPCGWNTQRQPGERPNITSTWLDESNKPGLFAKQSYKRSYQYWSQIHWATPPWMTEDMWDAVRQTYESAIPGVHEVDHIVPLKHPLVCGLNVPWNLEVIGKMPNQQKSNHYWPDCPDHLCPVLNLPVDMFGFNDEPYQLTLDI